MLLVTLYSSFESEFVERWILLLDVWAAQEKANIQYMRNCDLQTQLGQRPGLSEKCHLTYRGQTNNVFFFYWGEFTKKILATGKG